MPPPSTSRAEPFRNYFSWPEIGFFSIVYLVAITHGLVMTLVLVGLLIWSVTGATQAIMAMTFVALIKFSNGAVVSFSPYAMVLFWLITMAACARLYLSVRRLSMSFVLLVSFALVSILVSIMVSKAVDVSIMKVVSFFIVSSALLIVSDSLKAEDVQKLQRWFFSVALVIAVLSLMTLPFPSIGFRKVAGSLQGMFVHPQTAGMFYVPFASWLITRIFLERVRYLPQWVLGMSVLFAGMIIASGARTAMLATFVGVGLTLMIVLFKGKSGPTYRSRGEIMGFTLIMFSLSLVILLSGVLKEELEAIAFKGDDEGSFSEAFESSRGAGVSAHIQNFLDAPLTGHGFGVYRQGVRGGEKRIKRFLGVPISASAEKGIVFTSVLEEVGIVGALLFYLLLISIVGTATKSFNPAALAMVIGTIAINFGEAVIFSANGMGLFIWLIIGFALARARIKSVA